MSQTSPRVVSFYTVISFAFLADVLKKAIRGFRILRKDRMMEKYASFTTAMKIITSGEMLVNVLERAKNHRRTRWLELSEVGAMGEKLIR